MSFTVEAVLSIAVVLRAVLCAVRIKDTKRNYFSQSSALLYDQIISPRTISSSIEMPESGYNKRQSILPGKDSSVTLGQNNASEQYPL